MNTPQTQPIPAFLERREPAAIFSWWSTGRLQINKDGTQVSLSKDDLSEMRRFVEQFEGTAEGDAK